MKHLLLLIVLVVIGYGLWAASDAKQRQSAKATITYHSLRLGALILLLLLLVAAAVNLPSSVIF